MVELICGRGKWEKPREKPTQTPFRPPRNPHGVTETRTRDPSGGRRAPNRLRHEAATNFICYPEILIDHVSQKPETKKVKGTCTPHILSRV